MDGSPSSKGVLRLYIGLKEISVPLPIAAEGQALCNDKLGAWQSGDGGHGRGCGGWLGPIIGQIRAKAAELDSLLLLALRVVEAGRPEHRLQLLPLRNTRLAIALETSKFLQELQEVAAKW